MTDEVSLLLIHVEIVSFCTQSISRLPGIVGEITLPLFVDSHFPHWLHFSVLQEPLPSRKTCDHSGSHAFIHPPISVSLSNF